MINDTQHNEHTYYSGATKTNTFPDTISKQWLEAVLKVISMIVDEMLLWVNVSHRHVCMAPDWGETVEQLAQIKVRGAEKLHFSE